MPAVKALALALCVALAATGARADDPVYAAPDKAPEVYGPLIWRAGGVDVHGYWFTDKQTQAIDLRIKYLEDKAAKECVTATNAETKKVVGAAPTLWIVGAGALLLGVVGGVFLAKKL